MVDYQDDKPPTLNLIDYIDLQIYKVSLKKWQTVVLTSVVEGDEDVSFRFYDPSKEEQIYVVSANTVDLNCDEGYHGYRFVRKNSYN